MTRPIPRRSIPAPRSAVRSAVHCAGPALGPLVLRLVPVALILGLALAVSAGAQNGVPTLDAGQIECLEEEQNGVVPVTIENEAAGTEPRLYFRWDGRGDYYWVHLHPEGAGSYWAVPPRPTTENEAVEYYAASVDPSGRTIARSTSREAPVLSDCPIELSPKQRGVANNLIVGETATSQANERVLGFLCDGIVTRVDPNGIRRPDEVCRQCIVAWWKREEVLLPVGGIGAAGLVAIGVTGDDPEDDPPVSPFQPPG